MREALDRTPSTRRLETALACRKSEKRRRGAYIGDIDGQRPDVRPCQVLHHDLVFLAAGYNVHDEAFPLKVQRERPCQGQRRGSSDNHNLSSAATARPFCPPDLPKCHAAPICPVGDRPCRYYYDAGEDLVSRDPVLNSFKCRGWHRENRRRRRGLWSDRFGYPWCGCECLSQCVGNLLDVLVDVVGYLPGIATDVLGERRKLSRFVVSVRTRDWAARDGGVKGLPRPGRPGRRPTCLCLKYSLRWFFRQSLAGKGGEEMSCGSVLRLWEETTKETPKKKSLYRPKPGVYRMWSQLVAKALGNVISRSSASWRGSDRV